MMLTLIVKHFARSLKCQKKKKIKRPKKNSNQNILSDFIIKYLMWHGFLILKTSPMWTSEVADLHK